MEDLQQAKFVKEPVKVMLFTDDDRAVAQTQHDQLVKLFDYLREKHPNRIKSKGKIAIEGLVEQWINLMSDNRQPLATYDTYGKQIVFNQGHILVKIAPQLATLDDVMNFFSKLGHNDITDSYGKKIDPQTLIEQIKSWGIAGSVAVADHPDIEGLPKLGVELADRDVIMMETGQDRPDLHQFTWSVQDAEKVAEGLNYYLPKVIDFDVPDNECVIRNLYQTIVHNYRMGCLKLEKGKLPLIYANNRIDAQQLGRLLRDDQVVVYQWGVKTGSCDKIFTRVDATLVVAAMCRLGQLDADDSHHYRESECDDTAHTYNTHEWLRERDHNYQYDFVKF